MSGHPRRSLEAYSDARKVLAMNSKQDVSRYVESSIRMAGYQLSLGEYSEALKNSLEALGYGENSELLEIASRAAANMGDEEASAGFLKRKRAFERKEAQRQ